MLRIRYLRLAAVALLVGLTGAFASQPANAMPNGAAACFNVHEHGSLPAPPRGYVAESESKINADCSVSISGVRFILASSLAEESAKESRLTGNLEANPANPARQVSVHQRLWDVANILLNEFDTTLYWQYNYSAVTGYSAHNAVAYHREIVGGWYLAYQNIWVAGGGVGQNRVTIGANAGFGYQGLFDPSGSLYFNSYNNTVTGFNNGGWSCRWAYAWRTGFPGWHTQNWCG
jgi:hypothetical protein